MQENNIENLLHERFEHLFEAALRVEMAAAGTLRKVEAGEMLMDVGDYFENIPLLLDGAIKIFRENKNENELLLYYLESGDTCAMSLSCCMGRKRSKIRAVAEEESLILMLPVAAIDGWLSRFQSWKAYIFDSMQVRMDELLEAIDTIAFMRMDERLLKYLRDKAKVTGSTTLDTTHRQIALDMNTSRVVISRILKQLELKGLIKTARNQLEVISF